MPAIDILLATYNGAAYLPEQLASLAAQTFTDWRVILRDDGSSDGSPDLVRRWAEAGGHRLVVIEDGRANLGAKDNFAALIAASNAPYFACCDQDDVWLPHKLERMLGAVQSAEAEASAARPVLAYSDLEVVDAGLHPIHPSFRAYTSLQQPREGREVIDLMTQNVVTGCASLGNAALRLAALPVPSEAAMHDWWLALVAAATGRLVDVPAATILYRQHGSNVVGAMRWTAGAVAKRLVVDAPKNLRAFYRFLDESQAQAGALAKRFGDGLATATRIDLQTYENLAGRAWPLRKRFAIRRMLKAGRTLRNLAFIALV